MKRKETRRTVVLLLAAYILGMTLGSAIIWAIPFFKNKHHILTIAADASECWRTGSIPEGVQLFGMEYFLFDEQGRTVFSVNQFMLDSERAGLRGYLPALRKSGTLFRPAMFTVASSDGTPDHRVFCIVAGVTITIDNGREYCSVLVRDLTDLDSSIIIFCVIYTMIFLSAGLCSYGIYRKERALNAMRRDLVANVSHELKTPITCIKARAEVLYDGLVRDETERRDYCRAILKESDLLEDMVMDILELSRLQSGRAAITKIVTHADGVFPSAVDRYAMLCGDLGIELDTSGLDLESLPPLYTDEDRIRDLLGILLDNAVKFVGRGGKIWLTCARRGNRAVFCVRDNGPGIAKADQSRIFDRFYKADVSHNSRGSGLGLAIADEIVRNLGEKLWVESETGSGAAFYFTVTLA